MTNMNAIQELVRSWLNPTALFCIVNLMIGAIFILMRPNKQSTTNDGNNIQEHPHHHHHGPEIVRVPSFIERVRSFNLSKNRPVEPQQAQQAPEPARVVSSFFERVRSFNLSKNRPAEPYEPRRESMVDRQYGGDISERHEEETGEGGSVIANKVLKKSASEKVAAQEEAEVERRRPETSRERPVVDDEAVDSKADDFINRFRQQLKMQRLDSLLRYREMLNRGASR